jgi:hypothetical protein
LGKTNVFRKKIFIQDDFNDGATAAEEKVSTLTSTLLFTTNLRRRRPLVVGQRILICASRFEVNASLSQAKRSVFVDRFFFCSFFFALFPLFHRDVLSD